jgi:heme exporter protein A
MSNAYAKPYSHSLTLAQWSVVRGGRRVIKNFSAGLEAGQILHVGGANGAGKSTLLRSIAGLCVHDGGSLTYSGGAIAKACHYVAAEPCFKPALSLYEHLQLWARWQDVAMTEDMAIKILHKAGLCFGEAEGALLAMKARYLSSGQRKKLHLASVLIAERPLWLLDEPFAGLDAQSADNFYQTIMAHVAEGGMVIYTDHSDHARVLKTMMAPTAYQEVRL